MRCGKQRRTPDNPRKVWRRFAHGIRKTLWKETATPAKKQYKVEQIAVLKQRAATVKGEIGGSEQRFKMLSGELERLKKESQTERAEAEKPNSPCAKPKINIRKNRWS